VKRLGFLFLLPLSWLHADKVQCDIRMERIYCTYILDRSDTYKERFVAFHWISPTSPVDDRIRHFRIPPGYGSVYDYRFLPGRAKGTWRVTVTDTESNRTVETAFDINVTDETIFEED